LLQFFPEVAQNSLRILEFSMFREIPEYSRFSRFVATLQIVETQRTTPYISARWALWLVLTYLVMLRSWSLTYWTQNPNSSSLSQDALMKKVERQSVNLCWNYRKKQTRNVIFSIKVMWWPWPFDHKT